jgi:hypothetical protein
MKSNLIRVALAAVAASAALGGCAAIHRQEASDSEALLKQAGFQARAADTPERRQALAKMPARQIVERNRNGVAVYIFADPDNCNCLYVGGDQQYARLQKLRQDRIAEHQALDARAGSGDRTVDSELWGPWEPEGLVVK